MLENTNYFSVGYDLIARDIKLPYSLFVNSSGIETREKFVCIFKAGDIFTEADWLDFKSKYKQLYIHEHERSLYLQTLVHGLDVPDEIKVNVIKDSAIKYLVKIFDEEKKFSTEILYETITECRFAVENMVDTLNEYSIDDLRGLISKLSFHDFYTYDHSINVSMYCIVIYRALHPNASRIELTHAGLGGLLHDLGKVKIPTHILNNPDGLTAEEYDVIKTHPDLGIGMLLEAYPENSGDINMKIVARVIHEHHENIDGTGYPRKLKEDEIHHLAKVCAVADFFDAITTKRSYNEVLSIDDALAVMARTKGKKIDPVIYDVFVEHIKNHGHTAARRIHLVDSFDPTIPYRQLPIELDTPDKEKVEFKDNNKDFGKILISDKPFKKKKRSA